MEGVIYWRPPDKEGMYQIFLAISIEDYTCPRPEKGLNNYYGQEPADRITNNKNSWTGSWNGGALGTYCYYCMSDGKPVDCDDLY